MISLPAVIERGITAVIGLPDSGPVLEVIARLALSHPVQVIVGGNRFDAHQLARIIRGHTVHLDQTLARIQQARPFTCFQAIKLLEETESTTPLIIIDMLTTFYDENISDLESMRLTAIAVTHLQRIGQQAPVLVTLRPLTASTRPGLIKQIQTIADNVYWFEPSETTFQPPLF
ncbi:MAG: hypothetical protein KC421_14350 [Anaerolineales bacterium]|nr:hypothetical protein [Anaerolineales bacterium]